MRETTRGRGQSHRGAHTQDRSICTLGVTEQAYTYYLEGRSVHVCTLLYTHVYTTVYTRVHNLALSMSSVGLFCMSSSPLSGSLTQSSL